MSFSAADDSSDEAPPPKTKAGLQGRSNANQPGSIPVDPAEIAALLGLKPRGLRCVSSGSHDSDETIRALSKPSSPRQSPRSNQRNSTRNSPRSSPRQSARNGLCGSPRRRNSPRGSPHGSPKSNSGAGKTGPSPMRDHKENTENVPPPGSDRPGLKLSVLFDTKDLEYAEDSPSRGAHTRYHASSLVPDGKGEATPPPPYSQPFNKRKLSGSVSSPQVLRKQVVRRNLPSPTAPSFAPAGVATPGGTFGAVPGDCPTDKWAWLLEPASVETLAQLEDEAQDPPSPATSAESSAWAAILKPREPVKAPRPMLASPKDVFSSPKTACGSLLFEEAKSDGSSSLEKNLGKPMDISPTRSGSSPERTSTSVLATGPRRSGSPITLAVVTDQGTPTTQEVSDATGALPSTVQQSSDMSPTKHARREATALAPPIPDQSWVSNFTAPTSATAQWIIATSQANGQAEPALSASMAALTLSIVPVDPDFTEGDITLVCRSPQGYVGFKTDSKLIKACL